MIRVDTCLHRMVSNSITQSYLAIIGNHAILKVANVKLLNGDTKQVLLNIKRKHWRQFKELMTAVWGAIVYHAWRARNWKVFKGINVHTSEVVTQIRKELVGRVKLHKSSKKARSCRGLYSKFLCN